MDHLLDGRIALITGGTRGLGLAIGKRFAASGAAGILLDLPSQKAEASLPPRFHFAAVVSPTKPRFRNAVDAAVKADGRLDIVVANAGIVPPWRETEAIDMEQWGHVMAVNVRGIAATLKHAVLALKQSTGTVVAMASINAFSAHPRQMLYTASKHAVLGIVRAAARDLERYGVRVNAVAPGPIATAGLIERIRARACSGPSEDEAFAALAAETPLGRLATADEVRRDLSRGISGELLPAAA